MIRVAQIYGSTGAGGSEATFMRLYNAMDKSQVQCDWFVQNTGLFIDRAKIEALGGRVFILPPYWQIHRYLRVLRTLLRRGQYDVVHTHNNALGVLALKVAKQVGIKVRILHAHSTANPREWGKSCVKSWLRRRVKRVATHNWAVSQRAGEYMFGAAAVATGQVQIFYNALDLDRCVFDQNYRVATRQELGLVDQFVIGHVGRFTRQKNHAFLLKVFAKVVQTEPRARLLLLGTGRLQSRIRRQAQRLGIVDRVIFAGERTAIGSYYAAMDGFVLPSWYEGLPGAGVEAQISGLPCLFADTITDEVLLSPRAERLSLKAGIDVWARKILAWRTHVRSGIWLPETVTRFTVPVKAVQLAELYVKMVAEVTA